jgi:hypothetical protein
VNARDLLFLVLLGGELIALGCFVRWLSYEPAPAFARQSLRRYALGQLEVTRRQRLRFEHEHRVRRAGALALVVGTAAFVFLPRWELQFGPFADPVSAGDYLQTLWQVLAAAVGVSVALIAFVFEAFSNRAEARYGSTLREFARQTRIMWFFDLAAFSLVLTGLVLAGLGHQAPAGWPGFWAAVLSGATLLVLLVVVPRSILFSLDPRRLTALRLDATLKLAQRAVREQLLGQIVSTNLFRRRESGLTHGIAGLGPGTPVPARREGVLHDIRLGALLRGLRHLTLTAEAPAQVVADLEKAVRADSQLIMLPRPISRRQTHNLRRAFRIRRGNADLAAVALDDNLARLQQHIEAAVSRQDVAEWRELDRLLERVLLELPRTAARLGIPFDDAVNRPGLFGQGPTRRIFDILDAAFERALAVESRELAHSILYSPSAVGREAHELAAAPLVEDTAMFYLRAYYAARQHRRDAERSQLAGQLPQEIVDDLLQLAQSVSHGLSFPEAGETLETMRRRCELGAAHLRRVLRAVTELARASITEGDQATVDALFSGLNDLTEFWDYWVEDPRGQAQRELLEELATMRLALASWALHLLAGSDHSEQMPIWQQIGSRLLDPLRSEDMAAGFHRLAGRTGPFGSDYGFWFYDMDTGGVQGLDPDGRTARAVVLGLALRAQGGEQVSFELEESEAWRMQTLLAALDQLRDEPARYAPVIGAAQERAPGDEGEPVSAYAAALDAVAAAFGQAKDAAEARRAAETRAAALDQELVGQFRTVAAESAAGLRLLKPLLVARDRWTRVESADWTPRALIEWASKRGYIGDRSFVGQDTIARQMGRQAGLVEMRELVAAFAEVEAQPLGDDPAARLRAEIEAMRAAGLEPSLLICPLDWRLLERLGLKMRASPADMAGTAVPRGQADKFNGTFEGLPALDHPEAKERLLVIDLGTVRMEERPTPGGVGVIPEVRAFDADAAAVFLAEHPDALSDLEPADRLTWLQERVQLRVEIAWRLTVESFDGVRIFDALQLRDEPPGGTPPDDGPATGH